MTRTHLGLIFYRFFFPLSASCLRSRPGTTRDFYFENLLEKNNMAALVQTIPQSGTVPVLQTRPSSSSGTFSSSTQNQGSRIQTMSWTSFNAGNSGSYRAGHPVVAPYAYNPNMGQSNVQNRQSWTPHLRPEHRTFSAPTTPQVPVNPTYTGASPRSPHLAAGSVSNSSTSSRSYVIGTG